MNRIEKNQGKIQYKSGFESIQEQKKDPTSPALSASLHPACIFLHTERCNQWPRLFCCCTCPKCHCADRLHLPMVPNVLPWMFMVHDRKTIITSNWEKGAREGECERNGKQERCVIKGQRSMVRLEEGRKERRRDRYCILTAVMNNGGCCSIVWLSCRCQL